MNVSNKAEDHFYQVRRSQLGTGFARVGRVAVPTAAVTEVRSRGNGEASRSHTLSVREAATEQRRRKEGDKTYLLASNAETRTS